MTRFCSNFISHLFIFSTETMVEFCMLYIMFHKQIIPLVFPSQN
eukprot:UN15962